MSDKYSIKDGQLLSLRRLVSGVTQDKPGQLFIVRKLIDREVQSLAQLTQTEWRSIRNEAFPNWRDDNWTPDPMFIIKLHGLRGQYLESIGQLRLF